MPLVKSKKPIVLCVLDGWGVAPEKAQVRDFNNAIKDANPAFYNSLLNKYPHSELATSGEAVGLPDGQMGNSEVGHMTIGSGRIIYQDLPRISKAINSGEIDNNPDLQKLIKTLQGNKKVCHIIGLVSDGGVHSHLEHLVFLANFVSEHDIKVRLHIITDGRDTAPKVCEKFIGQIAAINNKLISIATISGRYYAMDRDKRYERTKKYYDVITLGVNKTFYDPVEVISKSYSEDIADEFILPQSANDYSGMEDGDALIITNFRSDRVKQLSLSLCDPIFAEFKPDKKINFSIALTMTEYSKRISKFTTAIFQANIIKNTLPEMLSLHGLSQLRIAETEKYAHVTSFFNAGTEAPLRGEDRILIDSPQVATYDLQPEMSSHQLTGQLVASIASGKYDFILVNFANTDMVGHTGNYHAAVKAVQAVDQCLERIDSAVKKENGVLIVTADHGNVEQMYDEKNQTIHTSHTTYPVPFILIGVDNVQVRDGNLSDIAPTILTLLNINIPQEMTGKSLIIKK
ncbi:MAG: 2,3-bisphosphoglycerate-independent phosphoglycerate mutase [Alphaproteobacteria bacterium]|jgi:2,3-bisphosphoglycerate-independent phosphoglycerate mutase